MKNIGIQKAVLPLSTIILYRTEDLNFDVGVKVSFGCILILSNGHDGEIPEKLTFPYNI